MKKNIRKSTPAAVLAGNLLLAPAVMAMRAPLLAAEARSVNPWRVETVDAFTEKMAATMEGALAAQISLAWSASRFWLELFSGRTPTLLNGAAMERALHAAFTPSGKRVRTNYNRLARRR